MNDFGEEVMPKGKKFTLENVNSVDDYAHLTNSDWTVDKRKHGLLRLDAQL
jgi:DNA-directed RNA polymerase subunit beta